MQDIPPTDRAWGLNGYLSALYGRPLLSTDLLYGLGYDWASIERIGAEHLAAFTDQVVAGIQAQYLAGDNGERLYLVVAQRYGLDGDEPLTVRQLAEAMNVTPDRVRQIIARALRRHRAPEQVAHLEEILRAAADASLDEV